MLFARFIFISFLAFHQACPFIKDLLRFVSMNIAGWPFHEKTGSLSSQIGSGSNSPDTLIRGYFGDASQCPLTGDAVTAEKICRVNRPLEVDRMDFKSSFHRRELDLRKHAI